MSSRAWAIAKSFGKWLFGAAFVYVGIQHFRSPNTFLKIMPPYIPWHHAMVFVSGVFEVLLGILLVIPRTTRLAAWGLIALLIAVFPANIYLYQHQELARGLSPTAHFLRLPFQAVLIYWAYVFTKKTVAQPVSSVEGDPRMSVVLKEVEHDRGSRGLGL